MKKILIITALFLLTFAAMPVVSFGIDVMYMDVKTYAIDALIESDVDKNIPLTRTENKMTFAVIIANENYSYEARVPYAINDGSIFAQYCSNTLGIPESHIRFVKDATLNEIRHEVNWITQVMNVNDGEAKIIFYYSGRGVSDENTKSAYLLPVDGNSSNARTGYSLDKLYTELGGLSAMSVTVFLDACFNGANIGQPVGNMVVVSASTGDETAYPYNDQGHGMFTYYLLKKLQETSGDVTLGDLSDYVFKTVKFQSAVINSKPQNPIVIPSASMYSTWRDVEFKDNRSARTRNINDNNALAHNSSSSRSDNSLESSNSSLQSSYASSLDYGSSSSSNSSSQQGFDASTAPVLDFVAGSVQFTDANGNNAIDAGEKCTIRLQVTNSGKGDASNCVATISSATSVPGVSYSNVNIASIKAGETKTVEFPLTASMQTQSGTANFSIKVTEPHGFGTDAFAMSVNTKAFEAPMVKIVDYATTSADGSSVIKKKNAFDLQLLVQNTEQGRADDVQVSIEVPDNVFLMSKSNGQSFATLGGGEEKIVTYSLIANNDYEGNSIPIKVSLKEKYGKYAESRTINLALNQSNGSAGIVLQERTEPKRDEIKIASIGSDVDKNIPTATTSSDKTFAVIIANENYSQEADVPYARNDGSVFNEYCTKTLGIPQTNVHYVENATLGLICDEVDWVKNVMDAYMGEAKVIFYYAGHGIPDENTKSAYLLPVDGRGSNVRTGYSLDELYAELGEYPAKSVTVFLDACFSGAKREGDMLASARGIAIKVNQSAPVGNMVVFSASTGDETAYPYNDQGHGMFTYYLLKKLQETNGDVTLGDLSDYVTTQVKRQSIVINAKSQTPTVIPSSSMSASWRSETLK